MFCFYLEHEAGLEREFQLEKGLIKGFKRVSFMLKFLIIKDYYNNFSGFRCALKSLGKFHAFFRIHQILSGVYGQRELKGLYCGP